MNSLWNDLAFAVRILFKSRRFTAAVVLTLAVGIASNTIIFSIARGIFFHGVSYPDSKRLVYVSQAYPGFPEGGGQFAYPIYRDILQQNKSFESLAAYQVSGPLAMTDGGQAVRVAVTYCTPNYFTLIGVPTALGRVFQDSEDRVGSGDPVVVLSYAFWQRQFSGAPDIIGRTIHLNERPFTVIGVTAESFHDSLYVQEFGEEGNAWMPLGLAYTMTGFSGPNDRIGTNLWGIGRLKSGVTVAEAHADLESLAKRFEQVYPDTFRGYGLVARSLQDQLLGLFYAPTWILTAASAFLLLIGCANVGNLLLARLLSRQRELAVRAALGASPRRLARHLILENSLLLLLAGTLGLFLATWGMSGLRAWAATHLPPVVHLEAGRSALVASLAISLFTGLLFGLAPALLGSRVDLRDALSQSGRQRLRWHLCFLPPRGSCSRAFESSLPRILASRQKIF
jgi:predicted permease